MTLRAKGWRAAGGLAGASLSVVRVDLVRAQALPHFWHHPLAAIESVDAAAQLVKLFPAYKFMLRPGVKKYVVVVTDDDSKNDGCATLNIPA